MIIIIEKNKFIEAIQKTSRFAQRSNVTLPVLSSILIIAGDDGIKFRSTNLEMGIDFKVDGINKSPGVVAIPAQILQQIAASLTGEGSITLEQSGETVLISFKNSQSIVKTLPYDDFPTIPLPTNSTKYSISGKIIKTAIETVISCASQSTIRQDLASLFMTIEGGILTTVATDSFRLIEKKQALQKTIQNLSILIPSKNSSDILQTLPDDEVTILLNENQIAFEWNGSVLTSRLTTGTYPDYKQIIPKNSTTSITILKKDFEAALRRIVIFSDSFQKTKLIFDPKKQDLILSSNNPNTGSAKEQLHAKVVGDAIEQSFNYRYLQTPLSLIPTESITLSAFGVGQPLVIKGVGDDSILYLVMPMNQ